MCFKQKGTISTLNGKHLKLVDQFTYLSSNISSTESKVNIHIGKTWTTIYRLLIIWKYDLSGKIEWDFFQVVAVSILMYGCTPWTQIKMEKKLDWNYTRMLHPVLNKSWKQHSMASYFWSHKRSKLDEQHILRTAGEVRANSKVMFSYGLLHIDVPVLANQQRLKYTSYVQTLDAVKRTCKEQWKIGREWERESDKGLRAIDTMMMMICMCVLFTQPTFPNAGCDRRSVFKQSKAGLNSMFSFSLEWLPNQV